MKIVKNLLLLYLFIALTSIFVQGCCTKNLDIIKNGTLMALDSSNTIIDTISGPFLLVENLEVQWVEVNTSSSLINSANATSCEVNYIDPMDESSIKLSVDSSFIFDNVLIKADSNFVSFDGVEVQFDYDYAGYNIYLQEVFIEKIQFTSAIIKFKVELQTIEGKEFANTVSLINGI